MNAVDRLEWVLELARQMGYEVRHEWLGGARGGCCLVGGRRLLFVDVSASVPEQLEQVVDSLRHDPLMNGISLSTEQRAVLGWSRAA
ncbi:MAG: hypothetical protein U0795_09955 [Pirellulales bacterium]